MVMATSETTTTKRTVAGMFSDSSHAERALNGLRDGGFTPEQVSIIAKESEDTRRIIENTEMGTAEAAGSGAVAGTVIGGIAGWLLGISALAIPGIGPIVGAGIIGTTLAGAGIGAATGGLIGALTAEGIDENDAREYEGHVREGGILLTVHATSDEQASQARQIFERVEGNAVRSYGVGMVS
jgi:uncharacterized membrane protein